MKSHLPIRRVGDGSTSDSGTVKKKKDRRISDIQQFLIIALALVLIVWCLFGWFLGLMTAPTADMYPRIDAGDLVLYYRLEKDVPVHDVAVYVKNGNTLLGRVVAKCGDTVDITDKNELLINDHYTAENGIFYSTPKYEGGIEFPVTLGEDEYFILADSREGGMDSRYFGPISKDEIKGSVITIIRRNKI